MWWLPYTESRAYFNGQRKCLQEKYESESYKEKMEMKNEWKIGCNKAYGRGFHHKSTNNKNTKTKDAWTKTDIFPSCTQKRLECFQFILFFSPFCPCFFFRVIVTNEKHNCECSGRTCDFCFNDSKLSAKQRIKWILCLLEFFSLILSVKHLSLKTLRFDFWNPLKFDLIFIEHLKSNEWNTMNTCSIR